MKYDDFEVGKYYKEKYSHKWCLVSKDRFRDDQKYVHWFPDNTQGVLVSCYDCDDWQGECDRDGNLIQPEPKVGQIWAYKGEEYVLNSVINLKGDQIYGLVSFSPTSRFGWYTDIKDAVECMEYVRG